MVAIAIFSREAMWKSNSRWATEDLIWKSDILSRENLKFFKAGFQYQTKERHCLLKHTQGIQGRRHKKESTTFLGKLWYFTGRVFQDKKQSPV